MKHFKFKTVVKVSGGRQVIQGVAATKKQRVTAPQATKMIEERVGNMVRKGLMEIEKIPESVINSIKFSTTVDALPIDFMIDLDAPTSVPEMSPEGTAAPSGNKQEYQPIKK